jgi:hypothetical protein
MANKKQIVYLTIDKGASGHDRIIIDASYDEEVRDRRFEGLVNPDRLMKDERIINPQEERENALYTLDALQKLALGLIKDPVQTVTRAS